MKLFAAARKIILRQTKNRSAENDFAFGAENSGAFMSYKNPLPTRVRGCGRQGR
ncbi:30S ribosomal protein S14 family protein [Paraprevotella xylaniphila YIT 11841]|uniref:30S ribosomal protein S14 family protein n=1 Tax=Paraprevotella xylaniphila YIT 11841 TaxID=762982 RepID=F3QT30_9BACT|nr:30S ribosomal protein S14 family protein [Paraprevotella xylaniphila YIT 11841]